MRVVQCEGKDRLTPQQAAAIVTRHRKNKEKRAVVSYRCKHCGYHHVGSK